MKVLHLGFGGQMIVQCEALKEIGVDATSCHFNQGKFKFQPDICLHLNQLSKEERLQRRRELLAAAAKEYDIFHFHFGKTFLPDHSDLAYLKKLGKKMVVQHRGSDVRRLSIARDQYKNPYVKIKKKFKNEKKVVAVLKKMSSYIDHAIVADHELLPYVKDFYKHVHIIHQAIPLDDFEPKYPSVSNHTPLIVHAPSHYTVKGSEFVINAIKRLYKNGYTFRCELASKLPHDQLKELYKEADIIIDQLRIGSFGVASLEGMALGKPVICYIRNDLTNTYPQELPILNASPKSIYKVLKKIIVNPDQRYKLGVKGRQYAEMHHDLQQIASQLAILYEKL
ncbi:glycosyltransferase involved in cell wall biosynthesis [Evansella vedderi]|uniref:Glycosyltransferase involved in cell wall biosynthesis n=1 Tax=Evansella vedderi TaxID=38282 RepID=A0ABT9ZVR0_9BACI|nr:glycosyltransferase family 4 protein [Evansella vedderi]MDQ0255333.1 glycosyltransferase involved in cell wall biosynthesis [Evansella vedderi]